MRDNHGPASDCKAYTVLYVDDEPENLRAFELAFRREFSIVTTTNGGDALEVLALQPVAVVLSDHRMPGMAGTELLGRVRDLVPETVRLLVTAYGDAATLAQAINQGCIYRYIPKPWDVDEMREVLRQSIELYSLERQQRDRESELHVLRDAGKELQRQPDPATILELVLRTVVSDLGFDAASVFLGVDSGQSLQLRHSYPSVEGVSEALENARLGRDRDVRLFELLEKGESVVIDENRARDLDGGVLKYMTDLAAEEVMTVPLIGRLGLLGAVLVDNRRGGRRIAANEKPILESLACLAANALENAQLTSQLRTARIHSDGAEALVVCDALTAALVRELRGPLRRAENDGCSSNVISELRNTAEVFALMLKSDGSEHCDIGEVIGLAQRAVCSLASDSAVTIEYELGSMPKVSVSPGRLLQLMMHTFEWSVLLSGPGAVLVSSELSADSDEVVVSLRLSHPIAGEKLEGTVAGLGSLQAAACAALAREIGGAVTIEAEAEADRAGIRLNVPLGSEIVSESYCTLSGFGSLPSSQ